MHACMRAYVYACSYFTLRQCQCQELKLEDQDFGSLCFLSVAYLLFPHWTWLPLRCLHCGANAPDRSYCIWVCWEHHGCCTILPLRLQSFNCSSVLNFPYAPPRWFCLKSPLPELEQLSCVCGSQLVCEVTWAGPGLQPFLTITSAVSLLSWEENVGSPAPPLQFLFSCPDSSHGDNANPKQGSWHKNLDEVSL